MRKMWTLISFVLLVVLVLSAYIYKEHKENELMVFHYAALETLKVHGETEPLMHGGTLYNFGQARYIVLVLSNQGNEYTYEVQISKDRSLVEIVDVTENFASTK